MDYEFKNARYNEFGSIDVEYNHPEYGWIPFTASPDDAVEAGRAIFDLAGEGDVADFIPPTAEEARLSLRSLTKRQLRLGLLGNGITTGQVTAVIEALPKGVEKETAKIEWEDASQFERLHPLIASVGAALDLTDEQIDAMWTRALSL